jgi:hypothetical protein
MAGLSGNSVGQTYKDLLTILGSTAGEGLEATEKQVFDGDGVGAAIKLSTNSVNLTGTFKLGDTEVTSTATELNLLDGAAVTTEEINLLSGMTSLSGQVSLPLTYNSTSEIVSGNLVEYQNDDTEKFSIDYNGVLNLATQSSTPTAVAGGLYFDGTSIYIGV